MPTLKELRLQARWSVSQLAREASVDRQTVERAERGTAVRDVSAFAIVEALSRKLDRHISLSEVTDLHVR